MKTVLERKRFPKRLKLLSLTTLICQNPIDALSNVFALGQFLIFVIEDIRCDAAINTEQCVHQEMSETTNALYVTDCRDNKNIHCQKQCQQTSSKPELILHKLSLKSDAQEKIFIDLIPHLYLRSISGR